LAINASIIVAFLLFVSSSKFSQIRGTKFIIPMIKNGHKNRVLGALDDNKFIYNQKIILFVDQKKINYFTFKAITFDSI
jgi:hypothetical protein